VYRLALSGPRSVSSAGDGIRYPKSAAKVQRAHPFSEAMRLSCGADEDRREVVCAGGGGATDAASKKIPRCPPGLHGPT